MGLKDSDPQYITRCNMLYFRNNRFAPPMMLCINIFLFLSFLGKKTSVWGKDENGDYQHFLLFPQCFQKPFFIRLRKPDNVWVRVRVK